MADDVIDSLPLACYDDMPEDALCVICQQPSLDNVSMCVRGHNACRSCADKMLVADSYSRCATCRGDLTRIAQPAGGPIWIANTALNNLVDSFQIKCPNAGGGCTRTCKLKEMSAHGEVCEYREVSCLCTECTWKGPLCKREQHMKDVDHGRFLVSMMLFTQQVCATMTEKFEKLEAQHDIFKREQFEPLKTQLGCIGSGVNNLHDTCRTIEGHTNKHDGSSARSKRRDRRNQKDVDDAREAQTEAERQRDNSRTYSEELKRKLDEFEARPEPQPFVTEDLHLQACSSRDRFFRERDEARHESTMAQQRIHDMHAMLKKMMPQAAGANCPCTLVTCAAGGGPDNAHIYRRQPGRARMVVDDDDD